MHRASSIFGSAIFLVAAPGTVAVYAPWAISHWHLTPPLLGWFPLRVIGVFMIAAGTPVLLDSFVRFAIQGLGTPAPIAPPQRLVVTGLYRWVRNPMYVSVLLLVIGLRTQRNRPRSEEHTSELQSRGHLVCRLLLEK